MAQKTKIQKQTVQKLKTTITANKQNRRYTQKIPRKKDLKRKEKIMKGANERPVAK